MNARSSRSTRNGFTLIELMIVVAIIGVLATVAIPQFVAFSYRAKRAEREQNIGAIVKAVQLTYLEKSGSGRGADLPRNPPAPVNGVPSRFDPKLPPLDASMDGWDAIGFAPEGSLRYRYSGAVTVSASGSSLVLVAEGDLDQDKNIAVRTVTYEMLGGSWTPVSDVESGDDW